MVGLVHGIVLFGLIITLGAVSGGHFNPAVTLGAAVMRRIDPVDALVYILAQLSGAVLGALLVKGLLLDEGRAAHYGAATISPLLAGNFAGAVVEGIGTFLLVLAVCAVAFNPRARHEWAPLAIGLTLGLDAMIFGPLTGVRRQPRSLVRPCLDRQRVGRRLALHRRPDRGSAPRRGPLPLRDRWVAVRARSRASARRPARWSRTWLPTSRRWPGRAASSGGSRCCSLRVVRRVTFSRNYTLSLSRTCRCYCKYCAFATHRAHLYAPDEVERRLDEAVRRNAKELLVLTGERPEVNPEVAARLRVLGA